MLKNSRSYRHMNWSFYTFRISRIYDAFLNSFNYLPLSPDVKAPGIRSVNILTAMKVDELFAKNYVQTYIYTNQYITNDIFLKSFIQYNWNFSQFIIILYN